MVGLGYLEGSANLDPFRNISTDIITFRGKGIQYVRTRTWQN